MKKLVTLLFIAIANVMFGQDTDLIKKSDKLETLVNKQTSSTIDLRQEEKELVDKIDKLIEVYDSVSRQNILKNEELENKISSNTESINSIKSKKPEKKQTSSTDWIKAIAQLFGIPAAIWGIISLFLKDKAKTRKLESLGSLAKTQSDINKTFGEQLEELKSQTNAFNSQSQSMVDGNKMTKESLLIEKAKFNYQNEVRFEELEEYYVEMINALDKPLENQLNELRRFADEFEKQNLDNSNFKMEASLKIDYIENINHADLYKIFVSNRRGNKTEKLKEFHKLDNEINLIKHLKISMPNHLKECESKLNQHLSYWNENLDKIFRFYDNNIAYNMNNNVLRAEDHFTEQFGELISSWNRKGDNSNFNIRDPYFVLPHLILPLKILCSNNITNQKVSFLMPLIINCQSTIVEFNKLKIDYSSVAREYSRMLAEAQKNLKESLESLLKIEKIESFSKL